MGEVLVAQDVNAVTLQAAKRLGEHLYVLIENTHDPHRNHCERERLWLARVVQFKEVDTPTLGPRDFSDLAGELKVYPWKLKSKLHAFHPLCDYYMRGVRFKGRMPWDAWSSKSGEWWDSIPLEHRAFHFSRHKDRTHAHPVNLPVVYNRHADTLAELGALLDYCF